MRCLDNNDDEFNVALLSGFLQETAILENDFEFENIDIDDFLHREEQDEEQDEEGSISSFDDEIDIGEQIENPNIKKTPSLEDIECYPTDISLPRIYSSDDDEFLNVTKTIFSRTIIPKLPNIEKLDPNPKPETSVEQIAAFQNKDLSELSDDMIRFQFNVNKTLETLLQTMKRTEETRHLLHLNKELTDTSEELHHRHSLNMSSLTLSSQNSTSLPINGCSAKKNVGFRNQNASLSISDNKKNSFPCKRRNKKTLCKFIGYKNRRNSVL